MKRLILLLVCALYITTTAQVQVPFYSEWCRKRNGEKTTMISDMKEKKAYVVSEARKTCMITEEINKLSTDKPVGYDWEVSHSTSREFLGMEEIDGKGYTHYYVKNESIYKDGGKDGAGYHEWICPPMKILSYSGCIAHGNTVYVMDRTIMLRRVKMGPQPAYLPQVPGGYQMAVMPASGLLEIMTGKSCEGSTQRVGETRDTIQKSDKQIEEQLRGVNNKSKSDEEQTKALPEMLDGQKRK